MLKIVRWGRRLYGGEGRQTQTADVYKKGENKMVVQIYQIAEDAPEAREYIFRPYNYLKPVSRLLYKVAYEGEVPGVKSLEALYNFFNGRSVLNAGSMRSMSVSDVIRIIDNEGGIEAPGVYYCDLIGFKRIYSDAWDNSENKEGEQK